MNHRTGKKYLKDGMKEGLDWRNEKRKWEERMEKRNGKKDSEEGVKRWNGNKEWA